MIRIAISIFLLFGHSCRFFPEGKNSVAMNRQIAQQADATKSQIHFHSPKSIFTFNALMKTPLYKKNEKTGKDDEYFLDYIRSFVERQFDSFYIGQSLMHEFDKELDKLINLKKNKKTLLQSDLDQINLLSHKLRIAWVVMERNSYELSDLYLLTLENYRTATPNTESYEKIRLIHIQLPKWLDEAWEKNYKSGVIALSEELAQVNADFIALYPEFKMAVIDVSKFINISNKVRKKAHLESKSSNLDKQFKKLNEFINETALEQFNLELKNSPQEDLSEPFITVEQVRDITAKLDDLSPDPGPKGHLSGNKVPKNMWSLTFDDGPHPQHSKAMFKVLSDNKVGATFFWLSKNMLLYPDLVKEAKNLGFFRASHSMTHANLPTLNEKQLKVEISDAAQVFEKIVGKRPTLFRCPYGSCGPMNSPIRKIIAENKMLHVHWNVDPLDWQDKNPQSIFDRTRKQIELRGKGIVLFHDVHPQSVEAVKLLIPYMKNKGYNIQPLPKMITEIREEIFESP